MGHRGGVRHLPSYHGAWCDAHFNPQTRQASDDDDRYTGRDPARSSSTEDGMKLKGWLIVAACTAVAVLLVAWLGQEYGNEARAFLRALVRAL